MSFLLTNAHLWTYRGIPCCGRMGPLMNYGGNSPSGENHFNLSTLHMKQPVSVFSRINIPVAISTLDRSKAAAHYHILSWQFDGLT